MAEQTTTNSEDWVDGAVDTIVDVVGKAREYGTENVIRLVRAIVYGLVALVFGVAAITLVVTLVVRIADAYLPIGAGVGDASWAAHLLIGTLLAILGFGLWSSRKNESGLRWTWFALVIDGLIVVAIVCYGIIQSFN